MLREEFGGRTAKQKPPEPVDLELDAELEAAEDDPLVWALVARLSFRDFLYAVGRDKSGSKPPS